MNDRGLNLTPTDMLKGYLLTNITNSGRRTETSEVWKRQIGKLHEITRIEGERRLARFIERDFAFYTRQYERLRRAADALSSGLECVHYNAQNNFTLQYPVLLAPLRVGDSEDEIVRKLRIAAAYIDILITRRIWNSRAIDYSTMQYSMFLVMREIRGKTAPNVAEILSNRLESESETFASADRFRLNAMNGRQNPPSACAYHGLR